MANLTRKQMSAMYSTQQSKELVHAMEGLMSSLAGVADLKTNPTAIYNPDLLPLIENYVTSGVQQQLEQSLSLTDLGGSEVVYMESLTEDEDEVSTPMETVDAHMHNITQLLENSLADGRAASANLRNVNELTPLDAFIPLMILRSYLPLCGKDLIPYVVPKMNYVRLKELQKWIVTKDNKKYRRPDVYNDMDAVSDIIASGKGRRVSDAWYPLGEESVSDETAEYTDSDGTGRMIPKDALRFGPFDLLEASGGNRNIGDALSHDVYIDEARGVVTASDGKQYTVEVSSLNGYYDVTSYAPQRSVSVPVKYVAHLVDGSTEEFIDNVYGQYDAEAATFELVSSRGYTRQVKFGGNLSNKNNTEYVSFSNDFKTYQHTIPEGIRSNFPITYEDTLMYRETANIDIVANGVNEMNEIFVNLEDSSIIAEFDRCFKIFKNKTDHNCFRFNGKAIAWEKEVDVETDAGRFFKRNDYIQDELQYALSRTIADIRTVCGNEPFKIHIGCHPNIASLFVGDNISWKVQPGVAIADQIRADYNMGIYTAQGDTMRVVSTMKFKEEDGIRIFVQPVNEENFLTWKHFKRSLFFDKNHRIAEMPNNPNIMGVATFYTHPYIPFQVKLIPKNYK